MQPVKNRNLSFQVRLLQYASIREILPVSAAFVPEILLL
jgi:hypothetical protein